jgi:hypothetical protein
MIPPAISKDARMPPEANMALSSTATRIREETSVTHALCWAALPAKLKADDIPSLLPAMVQWDQSARACVA